MSAPKSLVTRASAVKSRSIRWAWTGRLALGYLTVVTGIEGLGKSLFAAWLIARLTRGELPGEWQGKAIDVLIVATEDGIADTWRPRLEQSGADLGRVAFLNLDDRAGWNLRDGIEQLRGAVLETGARFVHIDAALDHMPPPRAGESINSPTFVRQALGPLKQLVRELEITGQFHLHPPKARSADFRDLVQASQAFSAIPRVGLLIASHPDDDPEDPDRRRVVIRGKGNIGRDPGALEFRVTGKPFKHDDGRTTDRELVIDVEPSPVTLADLAPEKILGTPRTPTKTKQATEMLEALLDDGERHLARDIQAKLAEHGLAGDSVVRDARRNAGVQKQKQPDANGAWEWWIETPKDALTPSTPRARSPLTQDAFDLNGSNPSSRHKASRRPLPQQVNGSDRRRLDEKARRARENATEPLVARALREAGQ